MPDLVTELSQRARALEERAMLPDQTEYGMYVQLLSHKPRSLVSLRNSVPIIAVMTATTMGYHRPL